MALKLQILSVKAMEWEGWCRHRLEAFRAIRKPGAIIRQSYSFPQGVMAQIICCDICDIIRIWGGGVSGFICHARGDTSPGGITPDGKQITPVYGYPLVDNDHGSFVLTSDGNKPPAWGISRDVENYGNIDWIGKDGTALTFRGPSGRQFPLDPTINYSGFTFFDESVGDLLPVDYYTPFSPNVYQSGNILTTVKSGKVTGVSLLNGVPVVMVSGNYRNLTNPDGGTGGFYDEIWINGQRIGWKIGSRASVPWFFNQAGDKAVKGGTELSINSTTDSGGKVTYSISFSALEGGSGTTSYSADKSTGKWSLGKNGSWPGYKDFSDEVLQGIQLIAKYSESSLRIGSSADRFATLPIMFSGTGVLTPLSISGPEAASVGALYGYSGGTGGACPQTVLWSMSGGTIVNGLITSISGCGMGSVTVSLSPSGISATMPVRLPNGVWVNSYSFHAQFGTVDGMGDCDVGGGFFDCQAIILNCTACENAVFISGNTKIQTTYSNFAKTGVNECAFTACTDPCNSLLRTLPHGPFAPATVCVPTGDPAYYQFAAVVNTIQTWECP